jgi:hypothetical protein
MLGLMDGMNGSRAGWWSTFRRSGASTVVMLCGASLALALGGAGCGAHRSPAPSAVAETAAAPEPYVLLRLNQRRVFLIDDAISGPPEAFPVAIGQARWPTPTGRFQINEMVKNPDFLLFDFGNPENGKTRGRIPPGLSNPLGLRWIGFASAHGWNVGFHGTQKVELLGKAVSHGCVRMKNDDVVKLYERVKLGTTVVVEP